MSVGAFMSRNAGHGKTKNSERQSCCTKNTYSFHPLNYLSLVKSQVVLYLLSLVPLELWRKNGIKAEIYLQMQKIKIKKLFRSIVVLSFRSKPCCIAGNDEMPPKFRKFPSKFYTQLGKSWQPINYYFSETQIIWSSALTINFFSLRLLMLIDLKDTWLPIFKNTTLGNLPCS